MLDRAPSPRIRNPCEIDIRTMIIVALNLFLTNLILTNDCLLENSVIDHHYIDPDRLTDRILLTASPLGSMVTSSWAVMLYGPSEILMERQ